MDAHSFLVAHGKQLVEKIARRAGTNYVYFSQLAYGHRRPSVDLARELVSASEHYVKDADKRLDLMGLLVPPRRKEARAT